MAAPPAHPVWKGDFTLKGELPSGMGQGTHPGPGVRVHDVAPVGRLGRYTMTDLAADHTLFSAALLAATGLVAAPVAVYWAEAGLGESEAPVLVVLPRVVLKGLPEPFDHTLYACPDAHWSGLRRFLDCFAVSRPDGVWESVHQVVPVVDWSALGKLVIAPDRPPSHPVHLYGLETHHSLVHWVPPADPWKDPVCLNHRRKAQQQKPPGRRPFTRS